MKIPHFKSFASAIASTLIIAAAQPACAESAFADRVEASHGIARWQQHDTLQADITVNFGGRDVIDGTMTMRTDTSQVRIDQRDGTTLLWDAKSAWISPPEAEMPRARFHLLTWPYFLAAPFKLQDPGSHLEDTGLMNLDGVQTPTAKLTFDDGIGDSPDDWYIAYRDPNSDALTAMAYIVTYGVDMESADPEPHAIVYSEFLRVNGVALSTKWEFVDWSPEEGPHGEPRGTATLRNIRFIEPEKATFRKAKNAKEDKLPGA